MDVLLDEKVVGDGHIEYAIELVVHIKSAFHDEVSECAMDIWASWLTAYLFTHHHLAFVSQDTETLLKHAAKFVGPNGALNLPVHFITHWAHEPTDVDSDSEDASDGTGSDEDILPSSRPNKAFRLQNLL